MIFLGDDDFFIELADYKDGAGGKRVSEFLNQRHLKPIGETNSRVLNHWEKEGAIDDTRSDGSGWRSISLIDRVWMQVVVELRKVNYPLKNIATLKNQLQGSADEKYPRRMLLLEFHIARMLMFEPTPFYLIVRPDGFGDIGYLNHFSQSEAVHTSSSHIIVNLHKLMHLVVPSLNLKPAFDMKNGLSPSEREFLMLLRSGQFNDFQIETKGGEIKYLKATEVIKDGRLFKELSKEYAHQEITEIIKEGKKRGTKRTIKLKYEVRSR